MENKVFTPEQIQKIEKEKGFKTQLIRVFLDADKKTFCDALIKDPSEMDDLSFIASTSDIDNIIKRGEYVLDNLWIDGDPRFQLDKNTLKCPDIKVRLAGVRACNSTLQLLNWEIVKP